MRRRVLTVVAGLLLCVGPNAFGEDDEAVKLMRSMAEATKNLNYDGVFIYQRDSRIDSMRIVHKYEAGMEKERLISLSGPQREVIRDGSRVTCLFADDREAMVEKMEPREFLTLGLSEPLDDLAKSYDFNVTGHDRIADRGAIIVSILPKEANRYGYKLWIDDEHKLLLKSVISNQAGRPLEQVQFVQVTVSDELPDSLLETQLSGSGFIWRRGSEEAHSATTLVETSGWSVEWLPSGFYMRNYKVQTMLESDMPVSHLVYSDGLAMVSIFVERLLDHMDPVRGYSAMGAVNAFSRVSDNHQITVVGEMPLPTVRRIASSVKYNQ